MMHDRTVIVPRHPKGVGKYRIDGVLGEGAMGVVYAGHDPDIDREVAIKTVHRHLVDAGGSEEWLARFAREARAAGRVLHQNLVTVFDYLQEGQVPYLVMERVRAVTLEDQMAGQTRIALGQVHGIVGQILTGLAHIHKAGIVHRDMKPANVMLTEDGGVKLTDFGIARLTSMDVTGAGMVGTPSYMAPEQFTGGDVDARADIYACGVMLYELTAGRKPFQGGGVEALFQAVRQGTVKRPTEWAPELPPAMDAVILKAMSVDPDDRYASASDLAVALAETLPAANITGLSHIDPKPYAPRRPKPTGANTMLLRMSSQTLGQVERHLIAKIGPMGRVIARRAASNSATAEDMIRALMNELSGTPEHEDVRDSILRLLTADAGPSAAEIPDENLQFLADLLRRELGPIVQVLVKRHAAKAPSLAALITALAEQLTDPDARQAFLDRARTELGTAHTSITQNDMKGRGQ
ncbi:MAG: serine/threonine-protein kinase [Paracoccaceae bacterium]